MISSLDGCVLDVVLPTAPLEEDDATTGGGSYRASEYWLFSHSGMLELERQLTQSFLPRARSTAFFLEPPFDFLDAFVELEATTLLEVQLQLLKRAEAATRLRKDDRFIVIG